MGLEELGFELASRGCQSLLQLVGLIREEAPSPLCWTLSPVLTLYASVPRILALCSVVCSPYSWELGGLWGPLHTFSSPLVSGLILTPKELPSWVPMLPGLLVLVLFGSGQLSPPGLPPQASNTGIGASEARVHLVLPGNFFQAEEGSQSLEGRGGSGVGNTGRPDINASPKRDVSRGCQWQRPESKPVRSILWG